MDNHGVARSAPRVLSEAEKKRQIKRIDDYKSLVAQVQEHYRGRDYSSEALTLTSALLCQNLEFYTIWNYRRSILQNVFDRETAASQDEDTATTTEAESGLSPAQTEISMLIREDLQFLLPLQRINPKVYWLWNHRSWLLARASQYLPIQTALGFWKEELGLVSKMLSKDDRNFHGWGYRREVITAMEALRSEELEQAVPGGEDVDKQTLRMQASMAQQEFDYADRMVRANFSNFSAWHHRLQQLHKILDGKAADPEERRKAFDGELKLASELLWAATDPKDQSLWFYHGDLIGTIDPEADEKVKLVYDLSDEERRHYIEGQIETVKEILEDNEDCKWIYQSLISMSQLREKVGGEVDKEDLREWLGHLERLDPLRRGRWRDFRESHQLE